MGGLWGRPIPSPYQGVNKQIDKGKYCVAVPTDGGGGKRKGNHATKNIGGKRAPLIKTGIGGIKLFAPRLKWELRHVFEEGGGGAKEGNE